ncbi:kinesin-like protein KIN-4A isoform X2 [Hibiscus syriacus]|uniref:kinesin-like protein KIN-4A isoform X2 n=1 Tax=Hibiscus syriacus TaxID=106335 RepID=UPI0019233CD6|nr:kinesin-like protein KIN-4A isoform X2 [Hibiscus syriacus]
MDLKKKQENEESDEAAQRLQDEIQFIKAQKVQLQHGIKQEAESRKATVAGSVGTIPSVESVSRKGTVAVTGRGSEK